MSEPVRRILFIKPSSLGDIVHAMPTLAALGERFPQAEVTWLVKRQWASVVHVMAGVDRVCAVDLIAFENRKDRTSKADQRPPGSNRGALDERLELQSGTIVVEQDATIDVAHDDRLGQLRHQGSQPVLFLLYRRFGSSNLGGNVVHQSVPLLRQIVRRLSEQANLRRTLRTDPEVAIGRQHQVQVLDHLEQTLHILAEKMPDHQQADDEAENRHQRAERKMRHDQLDQQRLLGRLRIGPDQRRGDDERPGHQQTQNDDRNGETQTRVHGRGR